MVSSTENGSFIYMQAGLLLAEKLLWMHPHHHQSDIIPALCVIRWVVGWAILLQSHFTIQERLQDAGLTDTTHIPLILCGNNQTLTQWTRHPALQNYTSLACQGRSKLMFDHLIQSLSAQHQVIMHMRQEHSCQVTVIFWQPLLSDMLLRPVKSNIKRGRCLKIIALGAF